MKYLLTTFIIFFLTLTMINAQEKKSLSKFAHKQAFILELGGTGFFYSFNYELTFINTPRLKTAFNVGINYVGMDMVFPVGITEIISILNNHHLEIGAGYAFTQYISPRYNARLGYRFQKPDGHFIFRIGYTPWLILSPNFSDPNKTYEYSSWAGIAFGFSF